METEDKIQYPLGRMPIYEDISMDMIKGWVKTINTLPSKVKTLLTSNDSSFEKAKYRKDGWTVRQLIHHIADSHMNAYIRFKLGLTEETPTIKPYHQDLWAELNDTKKTPIESSIKILEGIHDRWVNLLKAMKEEDFKREVFHPEQQKKLTLGQLAGMYDWHSRHHLEHLKIASKNHKAKK